MAGHRNPRTAGATPKGATDEVNRRAEILRRYAATRSPSLEDDERFAAELGLARDSLYKLARAWRLHGDPAMLAGAFTRTANADRELARAAAGEPDLSGVLPTRRAAIAERIAELRSFLAIENPGRADELAAAKRLGMTVEPFRRLVRAWLLTRDPRALPGASIPVRMQRRRGPAHLGRVNGHIEQAISEADATTPALAIYREVCRRCDEEKLPRPNYLTVNQRFVVARSAMPLTDQTPGIAVDHVALEMPLRMGAGCQFGVLSAVVDLPSGRILSHELSSDPPTARTAALLVSRTIDRNQTAASLIPLQIKAPAGNDWNSLLRILSTCEVDVPQQHPRTLLAGWMLSRILGDRLGRFRLRRNFTTRPMDGRTKMSGRLSAPLGIEEARQAVDEAIAAYNAGREPPSPTSFVPRYQAPLLLRALRAIDDAATPGSAPHAVDSQNVCLPPRHLVATTCRSTVASSRKHQRCTVPAFPTTDS